MGKSSIGTKNYGKDDLKMTKELKFDLQFFAEDAEPQVEVETENQESEQEVEQDEQKPEEPELKYTDEDLDRIINQKFAKWQTDYEEQLSEVKKLEKMNAEEKAKYEKEKLKAELEEYKAREAKREMIDTAKSMFAERGITGLSDDLMGNIISDNAEATKQNVENFTETFNVTVQKEVEGRLAGRTPNRMNQEKEKDVWGKLSDKYKK